jgi:hypothetical protein
MNEGHGAWGRGQRAWGMENGERRTENGERGMEMCDINHSALAWVIDHLLPDNGQDIGNDFVALT